MTQSDSIKVRGEPTKELFVHILTRDIALHQAVVELLDNSADGAKRVATDPNDLSAYQVDIEFDEGRFFIGDNCGGIELNVATQYAFRFGRAEGMPQMRGSIGQFGVGMKRALFSFGRHYLIESATNGEWFRLEVDLNAWIKIKENWDFDLNQYGTNDGSKVVGTRIEVTELTDDAARQFGLETFRTRVENEIKQKHSLFINRGLAVRVNGKSIPRDEWQLVFDADFKPGYVEKAYERKERAPVKARIYAGLGRSKSKRCWLVRDLQWKAHTER